MNPSADLYRKVCSFSVFFVPIALLLIWHFTPRAEMARTKQSRVEITNYDLRTDKNDEARKTSEKFIAEAGKTPSDISLDRKRRIRAENNLQRNAAKLQIEHHEGLQIPEIIAPDPAPGTNFLTAPSSEKRPDVLRNFLRRNSELFGLGDSQIAALETTADYSNPDGNLSFVHFAQKIGGIPVFQGEVKAGFTRNNEIIRIINNLAPDLDYEYLSTDFGSAEFAVEMAAKHIGRQTTESDTKRIAATANDLKITFERGQFTDATTAEKFYFPVESGVARPAWRVLLWTNTVAFYVVVDGRDGTLLWRRSLTESQTQAATYEVYGNQTSMTKTADSPSPYTPGCLSPTGCPQPPAAARQSFTLVGNEPPFNFNNLGWIPDGENRTIGNAAEAGIDRLPPNGIDDNGWAFGNPNRNFVYVYNPAPGIPPPGEEPLPTTQTYPPSVFQQGSITHAFYAVNRWHDEMYRLGFTEQARNFQTDNFGRGGTGNDSISVEIQEGSGTNSANFSTPADGGRGRLQLFIWTAPTPDRDGALDSQVIVHEITHGLSNRLHGNSSGLSTNMSRGMGEGWGDFYALALLSEPTDASLGTYTIGGYVTYQLGGMESNYYYGIRRFPTAIMASVGPNGRPHNPLTFKYLNSNCDTFIGTTSTNPNSAFPRNPVFSTSSGTQACDQIHNAGEIWSVTLWEVRNQLIERHGAAEGNRRALQYITDGMKLAPFGPTFLQERDAIIAAAAASDPDDVLPVRRGFAIRGMGYFASIQNAGTGSNNTQVTESFEVTGNVRIGPGFAVSDAPGDGDGYPEQGETVALTVPLINDTGAAITNVTLQINGGAPVSYGTINNGQTISQIINYTIPAFASCDYVFIFNINGSAGLRTEYRNITLGAPPPGNPAVTVANSTPLTIPSIGASTPYGTTVNVSGLNSSNRTIKLEITGLTHTFPGDLDILLVGPGGQKFIVMSDAVASFATQNNATVVLKDDAEATLPATGSTVNMNGEWKPTNHSTGDIFPAPAPAAPYETPAPGGTATFATVFGTNGANMNGEWTLYVVDDASGDSGSIAGWKLTFEPPLVCFICRTCPFPFPRTRSDFDGDGKTDVSVFRPSEGNWYMSQSTAGFGVINWGVSGDKPAPGDFDGDGKTDLSVFRPSPDSSQPDFYVLNSNGFTYSGFSWGLPDDIPVIEDYDGDGKEDIAVFRPSNHTFYVLKSADGSVLTYSNIASGIPAAGDFDGDGKGDFATYSINGWYLSQSNVNYASFNFTNWGTDGDKPVPGDYDGDGKDDFAVFRPSDRTWYIRGSTGGNSFVQFGLSSDVPVPGDYDGDGKMDIAVYRNGTWYLNRSTAGISIAQFGLGSDTPLPNCYLP
jgi:subtilisin-like proprotein convertase family protein